MFEATEWYGNTNVHYETNLSLHNAYLSSSVYLKDMKIPLVYYIFN